MHSIIPATPTGANPMVRTSDTPDKDDDPRKGYKCKDCGKRFDRLCSLEVGYCSIFLLKEVLIRPFCIRRRTL